MPETPGLDFELNEAVRKEHLATDDPGIFLPTPEWNIESSWDRLWS